MGNNWQAEFISCNTSPNDQNTRLDAYYVGQTLYFHFMLMGGPLNDKITVSAETLINDQLISVTTLDVSIGNGSAFYFPVIPNVAGKTELRLYYKNERGEKVDLQGAYAYVQNNAVSKQAEKKDNGKKSHGLVFWLVMLGIFLFVYYLASNDKIPGVDGRFLRFNSSSSSSSPSSSSSAGSSTSSSTTRSGDPLSGTTWKYARNYGPYTTISFSKGSFTYVTINDFLTEKQEIQTGKYTIHGNMIDFDNEFGKNVGWKITGNHLILTIGGEETAWEKQ